MAIKRVCGVEGCNQAHKARGFCKHHYQLLITQTQQAQPRQGENRVKCSEEGCDERAYYRCHGKCRRHYVPSPSTDKTDYTTVSVQYAPAVIEARGTRPK